MSMKPNHENLPHFDWVAFRSLPPVLVAELALVVELALVAELVSEKGVLICGTQMLAQDKIFAT
jgi:hypothetical protein